MLVLTAIFIRYGTHNSPFIAMHIICIHVVVLDACLIASHGCFCRFYEFRCFCHHEWHNNHAECSRGRRFCFVVENNFSIHDNSNEFKLRWPGLSLQGKKHNSDMNFYCCSAVSLFAYFFIIALFAISMLINCIQSFYVSNHQRAARFQWTNFLHIYTHRRLSRCELWVHCQLI